MTRIAVVPQVSGVGGMVSFRARFSAGLQARGIEVVTDLRGDGLDAVLVIGGTRDLTGLWRARRKGIRIVQRLNGMNWLHKHLKTGWKHYLRAEYGNRVLGVIRSRLANRIIYQSEFARDWWERIHGLTQVPASVVYNAVDLSLCRPGDHEDNVESRMPSDRYRILLVEGSLMGGYEMGLETALLLLKALNSAHSHLLGREVELVVAGRVPEATRRRCEDQVNFPLIWAGLVTPEEIISLDRSAHLLYAADLNPACPNAVIEALACGLPVLAYNTGALPELVQDGGGEVVAYGADPWQLESPDINPLAEAAVKILTRQQEYRTAARNRAEAAFGLDTMLDGYLDELLG